MKKIFLLIFLFLLLASCSSKTTEVKSSLTSYNWSWFSIDVPVSWLVIESSGSTLPKPREGNLEVVVTSKEQKDWFINNLIILSKELEETTTSVDFMTKNNPKNYKWYEEYLEESSKDFEFTDWEKTKLYIFNAKYNKDSPKLKFIQTARVCWEKKSFFLTIGLSLNITDIAKYEDIFKSFNCS